MKSTKLTSLDKMRNLTKRRSDSRQSPKNVIDSGVVSSVTPKRRSNLLEITIIVLIIAGISTFGISIWRSHQSRIRDNETKQLVAQLGSNLEEFYITGGRGFYPTNADLKNSAWMQKYMKNVPANSFTVTSDDSAKLGQLYYTNLDTSSNCIDEAANMANDTGCNDFTLRIKLENGSEFELSSLNGQ